MYTTTSHHQQLSSLSSSCLLARLLPLWLCRPAVVPTLLAVCCGSPRRRPIHSSCVRFFLLPLSPRSPAPYIYNSSGVTSSHKHASHSAFRALLCLMWNIFVVFAVPLVAQSFAVWTWLQGYWICFLGLLLIFLSFPLETFFFSQNALGFLSQFVKLGMSVFPVGSLVCFILGVLSEARSEMISVVTSSSCTS